MESTSPGTPAADPLAHPLYRIAHLHGSEWVTLRPEDQHSPQGEDVRVPWEGARIYHCEQCGERVVVAPN
jgi:hypothetical protein